MPDVGGTCRREQARVTEESGGGGGLSGTGRGLPTAALVLPPAPGPRDSWMRIIMEHALCVRCCSRHRGSTSRSRGLSGCNWEVGWASPVEVTGAHGALQEAWCRLGERRLPGAHGVPEASEPSSGLLLQDGVRQQRGRVQVSLRGPREGTRRLLGAPLSWHIPGLKSPQVRT